MNTEAQDRVEPDMGEPVVVGSYPGPMEADLALARLEAEGIRCAVLDDTMVLMDPLITYALGGVKVIVPADDAPRAAAILNEKRSPAKMFNCPQCDSTDVRVGRRWTFLSLIFAPFPFGPAKPKHHCGGCGHRWRE